MNRSVIFSMAMLPLFGCSTVHQDFCAGSGDFVLNEVDTSGDVVTISWEGGDVARLMVDNGDVETPLWLQCESVEDCTDDLSNCPQVNCISSPYEYGAELDGLDADSAPPLDLVAGEFYEVDAVRHVPGPDCYEQLMSNVVTFTDP